jgi:hypothetical protein
MPDFHQPDRADRAEAERELRQDLSADDVEELRRRATGLGIAGADRLGVEELIEAVRAETPSNRNDPAYPDAPQT